MTKIYCLALTIFVYFGDSNSQNAVPESNEEICGLSQFRCSNGECIASEIVCNGKTDCADGSDETRSECLKDDTPCPQFAFRCDYGGCVDGDVTCDGIDNCADRSDETLPACRDDTRQTLPHPSVCGPTEFRCENGQCIDDSRVCDGSPDCGDRSDETAKICQSTQCQAFSFQCSYGACINGDLVCNGVKNCADGSDEAELGCRNETKPVFMSTPSHFMHPSGPYSSCSPPAQPKNGRWKLHTCKSRDHCKGQEMIDMMPGTRLIFECDEGYEFKCSGDMYCRSQGEWSCLPECSEIHCEILTSTSRSGECMRDGKIESCNRPALFGTKAIVKCNSGYKISSDHFGVQAQDIQCNAKGEWEPKPIHCIATCGVKNTPSIPYIIGGKLPNVTDFPWHATLYQADEPEGGKKFICGATIITDNLLITAAHCVYDDNKKTVKPAENFFVTTGNIFSEYDSPYHNQNYVKKARVKNIHIKCDYAGYDGNYFSDIAILRIAEPFVFTSSLAPICLDTSASRRAADITSNGHVAGFGMTGLGSTSSILQSIAIPVIPKDGCTEPGEDAHRWNTADKFCAGYTNGTAVCNGDSGSGLVFRTGSLWFLRGIVSNGPATRNADGILICDKNRYGFYTEVSYHVGWINNVIYQLNNNYSPTHRNCSY